MVDAREERGRQIASSAHIKRVGRRWAVPSQSRASERYLVDVATGERGYQIHRRHRDPGTHPVARRRFFALTVPRWHAHELEFAV